MRPNSWPVSIAGCIFQRCGGAGSVRKEGSGVGGEMCSTNLVENAVCS